MKKTNKEQKGPRNLCETFLLAFFAFLTGVMTITFARQSYQLAKDEKLLSTIPLRDDQRKLTVFQMDVPMYQIRFLNHETILYVSGSCLFKKSLDGDGEDIAFSGHSGSIQDYEVSPNGKRVVTSSEDGTLRLWDIASGDCLAVSRQLDTLDQPEWTMLHDVVFLPGGKELLSADMGGIKIWRAKDLQLLSTEESDLFYMCNGLLSPSGKTFCTPVPSLTEGFNIYGRPKGTALWHLKDRVPLVYDTSGRRLLAASLENGEMEILDLKDGTSYEQIAIVWLDSPPVPLCAAAISQDGKVLVSAHADGTIRVWNAENGAEREILHREGGEFDGICVSPLGDRILAYSNSSGEYCIWGPFNYT